MPRHTTRVQTSLQGLDAFKIALTVNQGPAFFFLVVPAERTLQRSIQESLRALLSNRPVETVRLTPEQALDLARTQQRIAALQQQGSPPVLWIETEGLDEADLEVSVQEGDLAQRIDRARKVLQDLNLKREALARLGVPIVFWVSPSALRAFSRWAADLFSANSGVFDLETLEEGPKPRGERLQLVQPAASFEEDSLKTLPESEIRGRIRLYEDLLAQEARKRPPHRPWMAALRMELSRLYRALGDHAHALEHAEKAAALYRDLAREAPDAFCPNLLNSLLNLAEILVALNQREKALTVAREAAHVWSELISQPSSFPVFIVHLNSLKNLFLALDERQAVKELLQVAKRTMERHPEVVEALRWALGDEDAEVRRAAAWALGAMGEVAARHADVVKALRWALGDEDAEVRRAAAWALGAMSKG